jgi:hypothetical protein
MPTNKIVLREVESFMADYTPVYTPIYPLFLTKSQQYAGEVGKHTFRRVNTVGDIRAKHITPKDTEIRQIAVQEGTKAYKKYFLANQFQMSALQDRQGAEEVTAQVLDEHQIQMDELFMLGDGTAANNVLNNGLYWSADPNYTLESSVAIALSGRLADFYTKVATTVEKANQLAGRKVIIFYGSLLLPLYNSIYSETSRPWKSVLREVLGGNYSDIALPAASTPSGANGWIVANLDQCKMHYTVLPQLLAQGVNDEKMYVWNNFLMGSTMLEVLAQDAVIRQPITLAE